MSSSSLHPSEATCQSLETSRASFEGFSCSSCWRMRRCQSSCSLHVRWVAFSLVQYLLFLLCWWKRKMSTKSILTMYSLALPLVWRQTLKLFLFSVTNLTRAALTSYLLSSYMQRHLHVSSEYCNSCLRVIRNVRGCCLSWTIHPWCKSRRKNCSCSIINLSRLSNSFIVPSSNEECFYHPLFYGVVWVHDRCSVQLYPQEDSAAI